MLLLLRFQHNLDDEAAVLFGNVLRWEREYLARQVPVLPAGNGFPRKVKPLVRLAERETAAYCVLRGIDYQVEECPMAEGNRHLGYKAALAGIEAQSPGARHSFYFGFLERAASLFREDRDAVAAAPGTCATCGGPANGEICAFCRLVERTIAPPAAKAECEVAQPVALVGALDQTGDVGHHEAPLVRHADDPEVRAERRERVVGDLRACSRDP